MKKILYVEDNEDTAAAVKVMLEKEGFVVEIAYTGKEAIVKSRDKFDLVLLDVMLPDMSGWDVFSKLKGKINSKFAFLSAIPVSGERVMELKKVGVVDYITKPFTRKELIGKVHKILDN